MNRERRYSTFLPPDEFQQHSLYYTIVFTVLSFGAVFLFLFSTTISALMENKMYDTRFGDCNVYQCFSNNSRLAIVVAVYDDDTDHEKLKNLLKRIEKHTNLQNKKNILDFYAFPIHPFPDNPHKVKEQIQNIVDDYKDSLSNIFMNIKVFQPYREVFNSDDLLRTFFAESNNLFSTNCYIYFMSLNTYFLNDAWLDKVLSRSLYAFSQNFWMKGPLDMSFRPFSKYENIEISSYSIYAIHSKCFSDLLEFSLERRPNFRIKKALNDILRDPNQVRLAHWLAPKLLPTSIGIDFGNSKSTLDVLKKNFPDAYFVEGSNIEL